MLLSLLVAAGLSLAAEPTDVPASFAHLTAHQVQGVWVFFPEDQGRGLPAPEVSEEFFPAAEVEMGGKKYQILFSWGPSEDPTFQIARPDGTPLPGATALNGLRLYATGGASFYVSGHTNNMFDERRKYTITGDKVVEVQQPYKYVGLDCTTNATATLTREPEGGSNVAVLPAGASLRVVLARDSDHYLVATSFGLLGWVTLDQADYMNPKPFACVRFAGD